jgi:hypothetical protein
MRSIGKLIVTVSAVMFLGACSSSGPWSGYVSKLMRPADVSTADKEQTEVFDLAEGVFPGINGSAYVAAVADTTGTTRNRLQDLLITRSEASCGPYKDELYARVAARKGTLSTIALLTSGAAAIVGGNAAKSILAGVGAAATGVDAIIDAEVLQNQFITIILKQIDTLRDEKMVKIDAARMDGATPTPNASYSVDAAIRDVVEYHAKCAFLPAIVELSNKAGQPVADKETIDAEIKTLRERLGVLQTEIGKPANAPIKTSLETERSAISQRINALILMNPLVN